jgi:hypothetical protein
MSVNNKICPIDNFTLGFHNLMPILGLRDLRKGQTKFKIP